MSRGERWRWYVHIALLVTLAGSLVTLIYLSHSITIHVIVGVASAAELQAVIAAAASPPPDLDWDEMALEDPSPLADKGWAAA